MAAVSSRMQRTLTVAGLDQRLGSGSALWALALLGSGMALASPAAAQQSVTPAPTSPDTTQTDTTEQQPPEVVVTGTILRRTNTETPSPVTVLDARSLDQRGITSAADAIRSISADSSGSVPAAFAGGFGTGASGVSLRGLSVDSTLVVFDGLRGAKYPLADDGQRSFTDLNTIPDAIIDRIEVLKDGASSTYGSDAIAGVVNVITKREIKGIVGRVEGGVSDRGDAGHQRAELTAGYGDLGTQGWNIYVSGEYLHEGIVHARDRGFPYNTNDLTSIGGVNANPGAAGPGDTIVAVVRPATESVPGNILSGVAIPGTLYQPLGGSCGRLITHTNSTGTFCEQDTTKDYATLSPELTRYGVTLHVSANIGSAKAYAIGTFYDSQTYSDARNQAIRAGKPISTNTIVLPARLSNGQLNPNDPFAAAGQDALIYYRFGDLPFWSKTDAKTYRGAIGISGEFGSGWAYSFDATGMKTILDISTQGFLNIAALTNAIQTGSYNFVNPALNSDALRATIAPTVRTRATSELYLAQGSISKDVLELPGGTLQVGIGAQIRHEALNDPNQNVNAGTLNLNAYSAIGSRTVSSGYFEIQAPFVKGLEANLSGRYDHYSDGFDNFSPKVGVKFSPVPQFAIRGTYSRGFRAPSIPETSGSVIGYTNNPPLPAAVIAAHNNNAYVQQYRLGYNSAGTPGLKPEKSRSFTAGVIFQPSRWLSLTVDYYNIRKDDFISGGPQANDAIAAYYAGQALPAGYSVVLNPADPDFPNAIRTVQSVNSPYVNANSFRTSGLDFAAQAHLRLGGDVRFTSAIEATEILESSLVLTDGSRFRYVGTEGPYNLSSSGGTPRWKGNWQNTLEAGPYTLSATAYYVGGYKETADDATGAGTAQDCANDLYAGPEFCHVRRFISVDMVGSVKVNDRFSFYVDVINAFDAKAPLNGANYGAGDIGANYNPAFAQFGLLGRMFRAGATFKF